MSREIKFKVWIPYVMAMMRPKDIQTFHEEIITGVTIGQMKQWVYLQFTGLKDKNGKEIYEGDIGEIRTQSGRVERFVVEWGIHRREMKSGWTVDIPSFCFRIDGFPSFPIVNNYLNGHDLDIIEVIGNTYEHPELLIKTVEQ